MEIESYVLIRIWKYERKNGKVNHSNRELIWSIDIPRWQLEQRMHTINWITARFTYKQPKSKIDINYCYHDHKTGIDVGWNSAYAKWVSAKGQVTRFKNKMTEYVKNFEPTLYETDPYTMPAYLRAVEKLSEKEARLVVAKQVLDEEKNKMETERKKIETIDV